MINDPKDIAEILKALDKITFKQLDEAIKNANIEFEQMQYDNQINIYNKEFEINTMITNSYSVINSQKIEMPEILGTVNVKENLINEEGENIWMKETTVLAA